MRRVKNIFNKGFYLSVAVTFSLLLFIGAIPTTDVRAAQLGFRSLTLTSSANGGISTDIAGNPQTAGTGGNGTKTGETFSFTLATAGNVGSIDFLYCTTPLPGTTCTAPTGLDASHVASIQAQTGWSANNFTLGSAAANEIKVKRVTAASETATAKTMTFGGTATDYITNPTADNTTFFVRITTYSDVAYTTQVDIGTVASSTALQVDVTAKVQETLAFSVGTFSGGSGAPTAPGANCAPLSGTTGLTLGDSNGVLSAALAYKAHAYFRVSTNATNGLVVQYAGNTLQSGSNSITAIGTTAASSSPGSAQFGITIDSTDTQGGSGYSFTYLTAHSPFTSATQYAFDTSSVTSPKTIASSTGIVVCDTGSVQYLANIAYSTPAGIYTTNTTYIATPTY